MYLLDFLEQEGYFNCGMMMVQYFLFLSLVNQFIFFCIACTFAKLTKVESDWENHEQHTLLVKFRHFIFPIIIWAGLKYDQYYTLNAGMHSAITMMSPITYFWTLAKPGNDWCLLVALFNIQNIYLPLSQAH